MKYIKYLFSVLSVSFGLKYIFPILFTHPLPKSVFIA